MQKIISRTAVVTPPQSEKKTPSPRFYTIAFSILHVRRRAVAHSKALEKSFKMMSHVFCEMLWLSGEKNEYKFCTRSTCALCVCREEYLRITFSILYRFSRKIVRSIRVVELVRMQFARWKKMKNWRRKKMANFFCQTRRAEGVLVDSKSNGCPVTPQVRNQLGVVWEFLEGMRLWYLVLRNLSS